MHATPWSLRSQILGSYGLCSKLAHCERAQALVLVNGWMEMDVGPW